jgi:DNA-binding GntR family transcriptional regulator
LRARFDKFAKGMTEPVVTETPEQPEVVETPEASIVSENAETPAPEVIETPVSEEVAAEPVVEEIPAEPVAEPQAKASAADSILAKYNELSAKLDSALAEASAYRAKFDGVTQDLARLERSLGLAPARIVPLIENSASEAADPVAEYLAAVEAGDRKAASLLFEKHKAAIWQHRNKISKA